MVPGYMTIYQIVIGVHHRFLHLEFPPPPNITQDVGYSAGMPAESSLLEKRAAFFLAWNRLRARFLRIDKPRMQTYIL